MENQPKFCRNCGKKATRNRTLNLTTAVCSACEDDPPAAEEEETNDETEIADDAPLSDIRFGDLKSWFKKELRSTVKDIVKEELQAELGVVKQEVGNLKTKVSTNETSIASCSTKVEKLEERMEKLEKEEKETTSMSKNNLKYLINLDRNERRQNVLFMGLPEGDLVVEGETSKTDDDKCRFLFQFMGVTDVRSAVKEMFRLGAKSDDKTRPLKVRFNSSSPASAVLKAGKKLKDLGEDYNIYVKPDKTKAEQEEFKRIGKRKEEVLLEYNNDESKVKLEKGVLYANGIEVDRYKSVQTLF